MRSYQKLDPSEEEKLENKMWLNSYLEEVVKFAFTEVNEMKTTGQKCFPSGYNIVEFFVRAHFKNLADVVCGGVFCVW